MSAKKNARPVDPKPLYAAVGALDLAIAELRTAADDATGKARKQVDEALATATALRKDVARRARRAGGAAEGSAEHALNTGLTVASDANQRYEALADRGTKVVGGLLDAPVVRGVAGQVDDAARLVESVRTAADKAVESLLSLTGLATRAGAATDDAQRLPLADEPASAQDAAPVEDDAPAPIKPKRPSRSAVKAAAAPAQDQAPAKPKRPSRSSVKAAAQAVAADAGEPVDADAVAPAPKVTTTKATTSSAAARKTAAKKATATPATRKPAKKTTGRAAGTKVTTKNVTAAVDETTLSTPVTKAAPAAPATPAAPVAPAGQSQPAAKAPIVPADLSDPTA